MATTVADDVKESPRRLEDTVIPGPHQYVSLLKGLPAITDGDLTGIGVTILREHGSVGRDLLVPASSLVRYSALVRERLRPGSMNEIVGREQILFIVKLPAPEITPEKTMLPLPLPPRVRLLLKATSLAMVTTT